MAVQVERAAARQVGDEIDRKIHQNAMHTHAHIHTQTIFKKIQEYNQDTKAA